MAKALIQSHYPERRENLYLMQESLIKNGLKKEDIIFLIDYPLTDPRLTIMHSDLSMPINWWHGIAPLLDTDYVALLCDDLTLKPKSIESLTLYAIGNPDIDVLGYEGGNFAKTDNPYTDTMSHTVSNFEEADFVIRFYFGKSVAFARALNLYQQYPQKPIHDDILLSLSNKCGIAPTTEDSGWEELPEHGVAYSKRPDHYKERNKLCKLVWDLSK